MVKGKIITAKAMMKAWRVLISRIDGSVLLLQVANGGVTFAHKMQGVWCDIGWKFRFEAILLRIMSFSKRIRNGCKFSRFVFSCPVLRSSIENVEKPEFISSI